MVTCEELKIITSNVRNCVYFGVIEGVWDRRSRVPGNLEGSGRGRFSRKKLRSYLCTGSYYFVISAIATLRVVRLQLVSPDELTIFENPTF